jgi:hypothetical protein
VLFCFFTADFYVHFLLLFSAQDIDVAPEILENCGTKGVTILQYNTITILLCFDKVKKYIYYY